MPCSQIDHTASQLARVGDLEVVARRKLTEPVTEPVADGDLALIGPGRDAPAVGDDEHHVLGVQGHGALEVAGVRGLELLANDVGIAHPKALSFDGWHAPESRSGPASA